MKVNDRNLLDPSAAGKWGVGKHTFCRAATLVVIPDAKLRFRISKGCRYVVLDARNPSYLRKIEVYELKVK